MCLHISMNLCFSESVKTFMGERRYMRVSEQKDIYVCEYIKMGA